MNEMSVKDMVVECLDCHGYDGLYNEAGCGCLFADLAPCGEMSQNCEAAYRFDCQRCAKRPICRLADDEQPWLMSPSKDFCEPSYTTAAPAAVSAAQNAALPACASMTVGEVVHAAGYPGWHAQVGIGDASGGAPKAEAGEALITAADVAEAIAKAIEDSAPKSKPAALAMPLPEKEVCQNTAKSVRASRVLKEDGTAEYMRCLEYGA